MEVVRKDERVLGPTKLQGLVRLARKVGEELADPRQFLDSKRRQVLYENGRIRLISVLGLHHILPKNKYLPEQMERTDSHGVVGMYEKQNLFGVVFPLDTEVLYHPPVKARGSEGSYDYSTDYALVTGPTTAWCGPNNYSSEGYKDYTGVVNPFQKRDTDSRVQHGGVLIDNRRKRIELLNYDRLERWQDKPLLPDEILLEANWYMDSDNQREVRERYNLSWHNTFNGLGVLEFDDGSTRFFSVNTFWDSLGNLNRHFLGYKGSGQELGIDVPVAEVADFNFAIADQFGARRWKFVGLEYNNGGTYMGNRALRRDFFAFNPPGHAK